MTSLINWARSEDEDTFGELVSTIHSGNCAVFIGAGLSANANYPTWKELLNRFSEFVYQHTGSYPKASNDYYEWAENCKNLLNNDNCYREFIIREFGPNANTLDTTHTYEDLDKIGFSAIVTTNYDACIVNASTRNSSGRKLLSYPHLDAGYLHSEIIGNIFHIHGIVHPNNPLQTAKSIVFTKSEYEKAYNQEEELPNFLYQLVKNHNLLFIGFSLDDDYFIDQVRRIWASRVTQQENLRILGQQLVEIRHYAILSSKLKKPEKEINQGISVKIRDISEDEWFASYGIKVLRYIEHTDVHRQLIEIVKRLRQLTGQKIEAAPEVHGITIFKEIGI